MRNLWKWPGLMLRNSIRVSRYAALQEKHDLIINWKDGKWDENDWLKVHGYNHTI